MGVLIRPAVGPLPQRRLDEALSLAVGLRSIGPREAMLNAQILAGCCEVARSEGCAVDLSEVVCVRLIEPSLNS